VYPILGRRRAEGCLTARDVPAAGGPPRRYFSLTPQGKVRLAEMNAYWPVLVEAMEQLKQGKESGK
jgi:PadR family transcriptional regulator PadR